MNGSSPPGAGRLAYSRVGDRTVVTRAFATSPLKILNPRHAGASAWSYLATYGGGLVGGDCLTVDLDVQAGAAALLSTQASTKVYRSDRGATQSLRARAARDSLLVLLPDPVTCFAGSRYTQDQRLWLDATANLVLVDWFTAGRIGRGERWRFDRYSTRTFVWRDDRLLWHDALTLAAEDGAIGTRMDRFNCFALALVTGPALQTAARHLLGALSSAPVPRRSELLIAAASVGDDGVLLRVAGRSTEQVGAALRQHLAIVPSLLGDDPWSRKR